ncbi:MAG: membrane protein insertase YidC [Candidatus Auribacterota bacterium]|nr:membrane protein insertase YidC [Candidatus Auribacterota bacterium]
MDKVSKIGLGLTVLLLIGWFYWQSQQKKELPPPDQKEEVAAVAVKEQAPAPALVQEDTAPAVAIEEAAVVVPAAELAIDFPADVAPIDIDTGLALVKLNPFGGIIQKLILKENPSAGIRKLPDEKSGAITLINAANIEQAPGRILNFPPGVMKATRYNDGVAFTATYDKEITVEKRYTFEDGSYTAALDIVIRNDSDQILKWESGPAFGCGAIHPIDKDDLLGVDVLDGDSVLRKKAPESRIPARINWLGLKTKYFAAIYRPVDRQASFFSIYGVEKAKPAASKAALGCARGPGASPYQYLRADMVFPTLVLKPGESARYSFELFLGPANYGILKAAGNGLEQFVDFGIFGKIYLPQLLIWLLNWIYDLVGSYGWSIILLTFIIKIVLWPLTHKSYSSMAKMQKLQPQLAELKEKHKGDSKKIQAETMKLYKANGVNPMGGCLPMLLQMPILFALFTTLRNTILLRKAPFWIIPGEWIKDLSGPDVLMTLSKSYPIIGNHLNILPLLMGLSFFLQQKFTPTSGGGSAQSAQQQKMMATLMPVMFTFLFYSLPAGLNLYFMLSTFITIGQQLWTNRGN